MFLIDVFAAIPFQLYAPDDDQHWTQQIDVVFKALKMAKVSFSHGI